MFPYAFVYQKQETWLIWCSYEDKNDSFLTNTDSSFLFFAYSKEILKKKLGENGKEVNWEDYAIYDFDVFWRRLKNMSVKYASKPDTCSVLLDGFNFLSDIIYSLSESDGGDKPKLSKCIYDKLFFGCNLPSVTPENKTYNPMWSKLEIKEMRTAAQQLWEFSRLIKCKR